MKLRKLDKNVMRQSNVSLIFHSIYRNKRITRAQLAQRTGMSVMAVSRMADLLMEQRLICEEDELVSGGLGRPAKQLYINRKSLLNIGVSMEASGIHIGLVDPYGKIIQSSWTDWCTHSMGEEEALWIAATSIQSFIRRYELESLPAIGVVIPGAVDRDRGLLRASSELHWSELPIRQLLGERFPLLPEIILENNAKSHTVAEYSFGVGTGMNNMVVVSVDHGIGAGVIIDGELYRGRNNMAGEIGHIVIIRNGSMCSCGKMDCLQSHVSTSALLREARAMDPGANLDTLERCWQQQTPWAMPLLWHTSDNLLSLANLLAGMYAPETVVLGGSLFRHCKTLRDHLDHAFQNDTSGSPGGDYKLLFSDFGSDSSIIGAATVAFLHNTNALIHTSKSAM